MSWMNGLFLMAAIFGVGVTAIDLLGLLGDHDGDGDHGHGGHGQPGDPGDGHHAGGHASLLGLLGKIRLFVYFSLGFGLTGLAAGVFGYGALGALAWAVPCGVVCMALARAFVRFQSRDVDSSLRDHELLAQSAEVTVPLDHENMGRVRARPGQFVVERYALAEDEGQRFERGDGVEIVRITDQCVYVRAARPGAGDVSRAGDLKE